MQQNKQYRRFYRYAGVVEGPEVEPNHLARVLPVRFLVLERHQETPVPRGEAPRETTEVRIDLGQVQNLDDAFGVEGGRSLKDTNNLLASENNVPRGYPPF